MSISRFQQRPIKLPVSRPATSKSYKDAVNEREIFLDLKTRPSSERSQTNDSTTEQKVDISPTEPALEVFSPVTQQAIEKAEVGDYSMLKELERLVENPYEYNEKYKQYFAKRPDWAKDKPGCSMLSCSS